MSIAKRFHKVPMCPGSSSLRFNWCRTLIRRRWGQQLPSSLGPERCGLSAAQTRRLITKLVLVAKLYGYFVSTRPRRDIERMERNVEVPICLREAPKGHRQLDLACGLRATLGDKLFEAAFDDRSSVPSCMTASCKKIRDSKLSFVGEGASPSFIGKHSGFDMERAALELQSKLNLSDFRDGLGEFVKLYASERFTPSDRVSTEMR